MGTSRDSGDLAKKLVGFGTVGVPVALRAGVAKAALAGKGTLNAAGVGAGLPPDRNPRNMRGRWGARYSIVGKVNPTALLRMYGKAPYIFNEGAPVHFITAKKDSRARKGVRGVKALATFGVDASLDGIGGRAKAIRTPYGPRRWAKHPGMKGRKFFKPAAEQVKHQTPPIVQREIALQLAKQFPK